MEKESTPTEKNESVTTRLKRWSHIDMKSHLTKSILAITGLIIFALLGVFTGALKDWAVSSWAWVSPMLHKTSHQIKVLAVFPGSTVSIPMEKGLDIKTPQLVEGKNWDLEFVREGNSPEATERDLLQKLKNDNNIVMVIGHESSTTVKALNEKVYELESFIQDGGPIPIILPAVTNPDITQSPRAGQRHTLRLPATDGKQVDEILNLLGCLTPPPKRITLVADKSNKEYSDYISKELVARSPASSIVDAVGVDITSEGFSPKRFLEANPDTIIFIGMEIEADIFLRRLKNDSNIHVRLGQDGLRLIFTDGVAGETFEKVSTNVLADGERVFLTGPFPAEVHKGEFTKFPTYEPYAALARKIAIDTLTTAEREGGITRHRVLEVIQGLMGKQTEYSYGQVKASFDNNGDNRLGRMHVYEIGRNSTIHSHLCSCRD